MLPMVILVLCCILFYDMQKIIEFGLKDWPKSGFDLDEKLEMEEQSRRNTVISKKITAQMHNLAITPTPTPRHSMNKDIISFTSDDKR